MAKSKPQRKAIKFLTGWNGRLAGSVSTTLTPGIMATLVTGGTAEWFIPKYTTTKRKQQRANAKRDIQDNERPGD